MAIRIDTDQQNAQLDNSGSGPVAEMANSGTLKIYTGAQPASANDAATGTLLCTITLPADAFGAAAAGAAAKAGTWSATVTTGGTAGWFRLANTGDTQRLDGTCGLGGGDLSFDDNVLVQDGTVIVDTFSVSQPAA